ncbi:unnamed protein product [Acanthoscelides obtectus]|uniref:TFIIS N-terminal domain-containing protein n=1 Tax=Acanthoscelides obtectus TaxID=200917 RepID=A0A9P0LII5_ACAOB|nr:unnamed protein product [Acanthoscelides obtectus]CAK1653642.1 Serine/threonine-protein phosphatase 1 regulatory subunit 10 [Acanthoscelides obtectus]
MPRIDPLQLLKCFSPFLTPEGGILSREEVPRLVDLMMKFSKKLVSKCVYILILKHTQTDFVDLFMAGGGWHLIQTWLQDAIHNSNWELVKEVLGLLLMTPVDVERLKLNILPKLVKSLSRREEQDGVAQLSNQLVQQWLSVVKSNTASQQQPPNAPAVPETNKNATPVEAASAPAVTEQAVEEKKENAEPETVPSSTFYSGPNKNDEDVKDEKPEATETAPIEMVEEDTEKEKEREKEKSKDKDDKHKSSSRSKSSSSSSRDKDRDRHRDKDKDRKKSSSSSKSSRDKDRSKSSSSSSSKDKDRDRDRKDRDRHKSNGEIKSSSGRSSSSSKDKKDSSKSKDSKDSKEKQAEKDKDTLAKLKPPTIDKLGKIPKKTSAVDEKTEKEKEELDKIKKKFSVGVKKNSEERPKTVKVFNSKMRSTGLEEEVKPAPPRPVKKPTPSVQLPTIPMKRPSPPREHKEPAIPPEKKLKMDKVDLPERPGGVKLIPPKPKRGIQTGNVAPLTFPGKDAELSCMVLPPGPLLMLGAVWYHQKGTVVQGKWLRVFSLLLLSILDGIHKFIMFWSKNMYGRRWKVVMEAGGIG